MRLYAFSASISAFSFVTVVASVAEDGSLLTVRLVAPMPAPKNAIEHPVLPSVRRLLVLTFNAPELESSKALVDASEVVVNSTFPELSVIFTLLYDISE